MTVTVRHISDADRVVIPEAAPDGLPSSTFLGDPLHDER
jgi:hypothetical protein